MRDGVLGDVGDCRQSRGKSCCWLGIHIVRPGSGQKTSYCAGRLPGTLRRCKEAIGPWPQTQWQSSLLSLQTSGVIFFSPHHRPYPFQERQFNLGGQGPRHIASVADQCCTLAPRPLCSPKLEGETWSSWEIGVYQSLNKFRLP